ncbi:hypothetical protein BJX63DRAFT_339480 [Aspergillus granulosus]|uniref:C2H2-type domain-containing protein n=1 Tax=Aspergillus granulosus TaxID=176169 RepID=A0ABR4H3C6_9EURO
MGAVRRTKTKRRTRYASRVSLLPASQICLVWGGFFLGYVKLTKIFSRDYDQVRADVENPKHLSQYKATKDPEDLPGLGRHYCVECAKWFESDYNLVAHRKGKNHKRRLRLLKEEPHSQKIAEAAVGLGTDNGVRSQGVDEMAMDN